jgi:hypothetical protein
VLIGHAGETSASKSGTDDIGGHRQRHPERLLLYVLKNEYACTVRGPRLCRLGSTGWSHHLSTGQIAVLKERDTHFAHPFAFLLLQRGIYR